MSSLNQLELDFIMNEPWQADRSMLPKEVYSVAKQEQQNPKDNSLKNQKSKKILEFIKKDWTLRQIAKQLDVSTKKPFKKVKVVVKELDII